jgi:hypothetical protein
VWVNPRADLEKRKLFLPYRESNSGRQAHCPSLYRLSWLHKYYVRCRNVVPAALGTLAAASTRPPIGRHAVMSFRQRRQARPWVPRSVGRQKHLGKITSSIHGSSARSRASAFRRSQLVNTIYCDCSFVTVFTGSYPAKPRTSHLEHRLRQTVP